MHRRALLRASAAAGALLAGCLEAREDAGTGGPGDGSPTGTDERSPNETVDNGSDGADGNEGTATDGSTDDGASETETGTATEEDTPTGTEGATETPDDSGSSNEVVGQSFEVVDSACGQGANRAEVARGEDRVDVDGTISGRNGCYTAELEAATYDDGADELTVAVRSYDDSDGGYCQQCIVDIDYRASVEFRDGTPETVTVVHNGDHVTTD